ncbi:hypothetical protein NGA_0198301 [Nannochloropsis gaditana CCMP526]|uniref:uncharacterized protein n=1 Tax=Nannochloropsis gaditana (strain CCMP526) TaxID=1093141 RepID=UPI00029F67BF|nr:hypothetical protein NGA_0198301 [Nannochloropsis gaditana CCMP526]XP_005854265.1 hypothetical protein NGA_0198302 [Nannochloropsis gaditana CCMP526]EKU22093.1 hypothetical protein NGA_0198302 [Nannochloropsis gaditana CCMP526]EKU22209.1 hypothetical protein NGA_0198301 [Nannochloropsis gaditana CCMP526]|eukprot:XP_005854147.1 hypothetical protein NGA_0198301 [Nannochloropsis gaditana CCMP526]
MKDSSVPAPVMAGKVPSELYISEKWDKCLERTVVNVASGAVLGLLSGFVLARTGHGRSLVAAVGVGCGVGASWVRCAQDFEEKEKA